jgi:hypothetical protein
MKLGALTGPAVPVKFPTGNPIEQGKQAGGPIGIYRDWWEALESKNKLAYFLLSGATHKPLKRSLESVNWNLGAESS